MWLHKLLCKIDLQMYFPGQPTVPVFTTRPVDQTIRLGGTATFTCQAESNPEPTVVWMFVSTCLNDFVHS